MEDFKCNHCKKEIDIVEEELFDLFDSTETIHDINCPYCKEELHVQPIVTFEFKLCDDDGLSLD